VALPAGAVEVLGELPIVHAASRLVPVLPFVAVAKDSPAIRACPDEVDCILVVPLRELIGPGRYWQEQWGEDPAWIMHFFDLGEDLIWVPRLGCSTSSIYAFLATGPSGEQVRRQGSEHHQHPDRPEQRRDDWMLHRPDVGSGRRIGVPKR